MSEKVIVGMSGGVDSSVAAYLLQLQGYEVIGVTMQVWDPAAPPQTARDDSCCSLEAVDDARRVCIRLGIPYYVVSFRERFEERVIGPFIDDYVGGRTPNPCLLCNRFVKWEALLSKARELEAQHVATGHYARPVRLANGRYTVRGAVTAAKDQTYALCRLTQEQLARTLMPLGDYYKEDVRRIAAKAGLPVADKPDSEDVCFVGGGDYAGFIDQTAGERLPPPGRFRLADGTDLGEHRGITHYTVGQRKGLGLSLGRSVYVTGIDAMTNTVWIGDAEDVLGESLICRDLNFMGLSPRELPVGAALGGADTRAVAGRIRYSAKAVPCVIRRTGEDEISAQFLQKVRAVTPGQAAVFYEEDHILCAGTIAGNA